MPGAPQSNIVAARLIDPPYEDGYTAFDLANTMYGGTFTSRINTNLREEKGWSYGVRSSTSMSVGPRVWQIVAQVQTDKTAASITELLTELQALNGDRPFTREELERVRNERVRKLPAATATAGGTLRYIADNGLYDRPDDYIETRKDQYEAVQLADAMAEFTSTIDPDELTWFITGDLEMIEEDVADLGLGEIEVWDADGQRLR